MIEIKMGNILALLGGELKDGSEETRRFREFIEKKIIQENTSTEVIKKWLDECVNESSGSHDPYNRAFQDLIVCLGKRLGFEVQYGRYVGKHGEDNYDGIWRRDNGDTIVLEVKTSTWPIGSVSQLGEYIETLSKKESNSNVFGLYVIGKGDIKPLVEQILGSKYKDRIRSIRYEDLIELINLKEELVPVIGEKQATEKIQNLLLPIESINIGNIVRLVKLIVEIATNKSTPIEEQSEETEKKAPAEEEEEPWTKSELLDYLKASTPYQRVFLAALAQVDSEPAPKKKVLYLMNEIAKRRPNEGITKKITGREIGGARAGLTMRRKPLRKEDIVEWGWDPKVQDDMYKIKDDYKDIITEWVKNEKLWIINEIG